MGASEGTRMLRWFNAGENFLICLPAWTIGPIYVVYIMVPLYWLYRQVAPWIMEGRPLNKGKIFIMAAQYLTWNRGTSEHVLISLAFHNLFHGVSSMLLVYVATRRRLASWSQTKPSSMRWMDRLNASLVRNPLRYLLFLIFLGGLEEASWDLLVNQEDMHWKTYRNVAGVDLLKITDTQKAILTSFLMMPQLSHYFLDGFIWRRNSNNPGLREALLQPLPVPDPTFHAGFLEKDGQPLVHLQIKPQAGLRVQSSVRSQGVTKGFCLKVLSCFRAWALEFFVL